jgi:hypothetical protein
MVKERDAMAKERDAIGDRERDAMAMESVTRWRWTR